MIYDLREKKLHPHNFHDLFSLSVHFNFFEYNIIEITKTKQEKNNFYGNILSVFLGQRPHFRAYNQYG